MYNSPSVVLFKDLPVNSAFVIRAHYVETMKINVTYNLYLKKDSDTADYYGAIKNNRIIRRYYPKKYNYSFWSEEKVKVIIIV